MKKKDGNNRNDHFLTDQPKYNEYSEFDYEPVNGHSILTECAILVKPKSYMNQMVHKIYEMHQNSISESYFNVLDKKEASDFFNDYANNLNSGLILVISNETSIDEIQYFTSGIQSCIKLVIGYGIANHESTDAHLANIKQITTDSIESAVSEAYIRAGNGQTILFAHVNLNFDLFKHIGMV